MATNSGDSLIDAARRGNLESVKTILNVLRECTRHAQRAQHGNWRCTLLHSREGNLGGGQTALMAAAEAGHVEIVRTLLQDFKVNVGARDGETGRTALAMAAAGGHEDVVAALLAVPTVLVNARDLEGETPLMLAAEGGHEGIVKLLLSANADANVACWVDGLTALMKAAEKGHNHVVKMILGKNRAGVYVNAKREKVVKGGKEKGQIYGGGGETALMLASVGGHVDVVETLLGYRANVSIKTADGSSDALLLALQKEKWAVAKMLVDAGGADLNAALMWGCQDRNCSVVCFAVDCGADLNKAAGDTTPLAVAAVAGARDIVSLLIAEGAETKGPLSWAVEAGHWGAVKLLHAEGVALDGFCGSWKEKKALIAAARSGDWDKAEFLLSAGADVDGSGFWQVTPLMDAASCGKTDVAKLLIDHGADVNALMFSQWTALIYAAYNGKYEAVLLLLENGADINATDYWGSTALSYARQRGHTKVEDLLLSKGART